MPAAAQESSRDATYDEGVTQPSPTTPTPTAVAPADSTSRPTGRVLLAAPRGYCAGVDRAVVAVEKALDHYGPPVYVRKEIVHNRHVVRDPRGARRDLRRRDRRRPRGRSS